MASRLSGTLLRVLKHSRVAWYQGVDGTTAYYEQPAPGVPGAVFINGQRLCKLHVDREGFYADFPSPKVQKLMTERGISLERGWTCMVEVYGMHINDAIVQSRYHAVRHHDGHHCIQTVDSLHAAIFVDGQWLWTMNIREGHRALAELELSTQDGWYPLQQDLLRQWRRTG